MKQTYILFLLVVFTACINTSGERSESMSEVAKDSAYLLFLNDFYGKVNAFNDLLETKYPHILKEAAENGEVRDEAFNKLLDQQGFILNSSEGYYYVDAKPGYFYNLFKGKVSPAMEEFLRIRSEELEQGFSDDAYLKITYKELYQRVAVWDDFMAQHPQFMLAEEVSTLYTSYMEVLLFGIDNSPIFEYSSGQLLPEIKKLYEDIIASNRKGRSTEIIMNYYNLLKANNFKQFSEEELIKQKLNL